MIEINSQVLTQSEQPVDFNTTKTQEVFLSKIFSLMNKNPNYKMLGALGRMFESCRPDQSETGFPACLF